MIPNSRGLCWLKKEQGHRTHAFYVSSEGIPGKQSLCQEWSFDPTLVPAHRRQEAPCRRCREIAGKMPKTVGDACETAQPDGRGKACRNCNFAIQPTYPGWRHAVRKVA